MSAPAASWATGPGLALARALWDEGVGTTEIGRRVGCTKSAILGYAKRHGWGPHLHQLTGGVARRRKLPHPVEGRRETCRPDVLAEPTPGFRQCQWLEGHDRRTWRMCEAPTAESSAYCQDHHSRCFVRSPRWVAGVAP